MTTPKIPLEPLAWEEPGVETLALGHSLIALCEPLISGPDAYAHNGIFLTPTWTQPFTWTQPPLPETPSGAPSLESIM